MTDETINRILDMFESYGIHTIGAYLLASAITFAVVLVLFIIAFVVVLKKMNESSKRMDDFWL